ncbi:MAG: mechanosensitive ion channel [Gammaproteobacteria bacterium]|jgi:miniconductance mechanosensitive channel|nr:mechanosensitive ion channel protein MscS [Chromatiales bacterium]MCP4927197.1 mechanosensitive ion channel [Gammaproteobacteria bacterium]MDP7296909.1 mechanosensitive ion channel [Gammaproteobacteria bacterium]MDP7420140.1 mechanosensitive ion channel [Gammaproteobacteria bacterium]MDP7661533.1 mechanosensitive ion channel [Gammaproteobacteria bacterium]
MIEQLSTVHPLLPVVAGSLTLLLVAILSDFVARRLLLVAVRAAARRTRSGWDDALLEHNVFGRLAQIVPVSIISFGIVLVPDIGESVEKIIRNVASAYMVLMIMLSLIGVLSAGNQIYETRPVARHRPIKGFVQLAQIGIYILGAVIVIATLIDRSPAILLSGFGAMTAVLLIVFKDTLLSLVASIQLTSQDMIRVGDWLEMPQFGADGDVIDVALYTVTVQNWDKTITTIPTHRLITDSFKNWRGMSESGGRRIKRSISIDVNSIRVLTDDEINRYKSFALLKEYIDAKQTELRDYNTALDEPGESGVNLRRLTNIGTFRAYIHSYLKHHPKIHQGMTLIVRQLQPGAKGLPIEIYAFSNDTDWAVYEDIQADIFDHICAIAPEFGLRLYQKPAGADLTDLRI